MDEEKTDEEKTIEEFLLIDGVDDDIAFILLNAGIKSISDLISRDPQKLSDKIGYPLQEVKKWINSALTIKENEKLMESEEIILNLKDFLNISYDDARILRDIGVFSINDLANEDPDELSDDSGFDIQYIKLWIKKAKKSLKNKKNTINN